MFDDDPAVLTIPAPVKPRRLPQWQVLLHNDDVNEIFYVVRTIIELLGLEREDAAMRTIEAHETGVSLLIETHREHAELIQEQFESKRLTVTIQSAP